MTLIASLKGQVDDKSTSSDAELTELKSQVSILQQENKWLQERNEKEKTDFETTIEGLDKEKGDLKEQVERVKTECQ